MKAKVELIDVTESAREMPMHVPGWQVAVTQTAWNQCVRSEKADQDEEAGRLIDLLYFFWGALRNTPGRSSLVAGFGFEIGRFISDLECSTTPPERRGTTGVLLAVLACIGGAGEPRLVVLSLDEAGY
jgi:hypothetical protein